MQIRIQKYKPTRYLFKNPENGFRVSSKRRLYYESRLKNRKFLELRFIRNSKAMLNSNKWNFFVQKLTIETQQRVKSVQSEQKRQRNVVIVIVLMSLFISLNRFYACSVVSNVDFAQVNVIWFDEFNH